MSPPLFVTGVAGFLSLHDVKDRSWDEDIQPLRHPGLGEVSATLVSAGLNALRLERWFPPCCPCPCKSGFGPSAEFTDLAIVLSQGRGPRHHRVVHLL